MDCYQAALALEKGLQEDDARTVLVGMEAIEKMPDKYSSMVSKGLIRRSMKYLKRKGYKVDVD